MGIRIVKLPDVGEGVAEAELVEWHVEVGQSVLEDQLLAAVMTDKATVEIPSPVAGTVIALGGEVGGVLAVGAELVRLEVAGEGDQEVAAAPREAAAPSTPPAAAPAPSPTPVKPPAAKATEAPPAEPRPVARGFLGPPRPAGEKPIASPAVRRRARDSGVDLRQVRGSGPAGRITHDDLDAFLRGGPQPSGLRARVANTGVETVKVIGLRRRIAQAMADSKRRVAHFSYVEEIDVTALEDLRATLNAAGRPDRPRLTLMPFLMHALVRAVADFPEMNALYDDEAETIERHGGVHIGIATQTDSGLMVPVVRHCETRSLWDCAAEIRRLAEAARDGRATRAELTGSTITITSLGALGGIVTTPVINRPEVAIIGVNKEVVRPVWQDGRFVPRTMMNLSSSFDHRVIDGYVAARFVQRIKALLETPATLFIEE
ncbi:dihydrolipoamide acetyltransferase family protein [Enhydrobacter sp.]|jgi:2-oxoisovalerate dehydrogenase E2 component (dihydrolipoyl transacylase)|uniref:dihydrolipoamide acetyltransferase family protein n=1 Tax=Enhydrobacter sp. TaxID=1894999 RepID=UPI00260752D7|nr:dihydrolipoamide acetyltransferase family protein [Enhydrobacter sp.]WIM12854.1 MAG: dihydrolipoamide acyltransferase component of branched-chain alpha-keto acid dehydrogenase complex [Enhydrobacter sp.]